MGTNAEAGVTSKATGKFPIAYKTSCARVIATLQSGGNPSSWKGTTVWTQNITLTTFDGYIVAFNDVKSPSLVYVAFGA